MKKHIIFKLHLIIFCLLVSALACRLPLIGDPFESPFESALPQTATDVHVHNESLGIDWSYCLKAKISEEEFEAYRAEFPDLTPHTPDRVYLDDMLWLDWQFACESHAWWDASDDLSETFVYQEGDTWELMKYEHGYLYINGHSH